MRYERHEMEQAYRELVNQEKPVFAFISALVGAVPGVLFTLIVSQQPFLNLIVATVILPAIVALFSRFSGRCFSPAPRFLVSILVGIIYVGTGFIILASPIWYLLAPVPFGVAYIASRRNLNEIQKFAIMEHGIRPFELDTAAEAEPESVKSKSPFVAASILMIFVSVSGVIFWKNSGGSCLASIENNLQQDVLRFCSNTETLTLEGWAKYSLNR